MHAWSIHPINLRLPRNDIYIAHACMHGHIYDVEYLNNKMSAMQLTGPRDRNCSFSTSTTVLAWHMHVDFNMSCGLSSYEVATTV